MAFEKLLGSAESLMSQMRRNGFSDSYRTEVMTEIRWLSRRGRECESLEEACLIRCGELGTSGTVRKARAIFGLLKYFEMHGDCPNPGEGHALFERGARLGLMPCFREVVDAFSEAGLARGLRLSTVSSCASSASTFFMSLQELGCETLADVAETDVISVFLGKDGLPALSWSYKESVAMVLASDLGRWNVDAARVCSFLPPVRRVRRNIQYLTPDEVGLVRSALASEDSGLCLRDRSIGWLLMLTGLRACDIAGMLIESFAWEADEIRVVQRKTGEPLVLPLVPIVGNSVLDYLERDRPGSDDPHLFLSCRPPYGPIGSTCVSNAASRIYDAAKVRMERGDRRGTHLFRHHAATRMVDAGVPRAVVSATLGHSDPASLDRYLAADVERLRTCSLSVERFPVREGVFGR